VAVASPPPATVVKASPAAPAVDIKGRNAYLSQISKKAAAAQKSVQKRFTEAQRQQIFWELGDAEYRAHHEASREFPIPDVNSRSYDQAVANKQIVRQTNRENEIEGKYWGKVERKYHITYDEHLDITQEGGQKNWPTNAFD
jgi:hypothetical protein